MEAELQRRNANGDLVPWAVNDDGSEPVADAVARSTLTAILDRLAGITLSVVIPIDVPQMVWTLDHGLHRYPKVTVLDSTGTAIEGGDLSYPTIDQAVIAFAMPFSGRAVLS